MTIDEARYEWARLRRAAVLTAVLADDLLADLESAHLDGETDRLVMPVGASERYERFSASVTRLNRLKRQAPHPA
jgi:hypothetical protein